jgi:hypothetical protein
MTTTAYSASSVERNSVSNRGRLQKEYVMSNDKAFARVFKLWAKIAMMMVDGTRDAVKVAGVLQTILDQPLVHSWREQDGVIYFSVESDGTTGEDWITRLENKGFHVGDYAKQVFCSPDFKPTSGVTIEIVILKGTLFEYNYIRTAKHIHAEANKRKLDKPNAEVACLIREKFTDEEIKAMGLYWIVVMHEPINDSDDNPIFLRVDRGGSGNWLYAYFEPDDGWGSESGFAFVVSHVSS